MNKVLFFLSILFVFACSPEQALQPAPKNKQAIGRAPDVVFSIPNLPTTAGNQVEAKFSVTGFSNIGSFQFAMRFDTSALAYSHSTFTGTIPNYNTDCCFGIWGYNQGYNLEHGEVRTAWYNVNAGGVTVPSGAAVFSMFFTAKKAGSLATYFPAWPDNPIIPFEAYDAEFNYVPLNVLYVEPPTGPTAPGISAQKKKKKHN